MTTSTELLLQDIKENPTQKRWCILKLERDSSPLSLLRADSSSAATTAKPGGDAREGDGSSGPPRDAEELKIRLKAALKPFFKVTIHAEDYEGASWCGIEFLGVGFHKMRTAQFLVYYPHSKFVFSSLFRQSTVQSYFFEALCDAFACDKVTRVNAKGNDLKSLADMALFPLSQGSFGAYRLYTTLLEEHPLQGEARNEIQTRKRRRHRLANHEAATEEVEAELLSQTDHLRMRPSDAKRYDDGGVAVNLNEEAKLDAPPSSFSSGALTGRQENAIPSGSQSLTEMTCVVRDRVTWNGKTTEEPISINVIVRGTSVMNGMKGLVKSGMVVRGEEDVGALGRDESSEDDEEHDESLDEEERARRRARRQQEREKKQRRRNIKTEIAERVGDASVVVKSTLEAGEEGAAEEGEDRKGSRGRRSDAVRTVGLRVGKYGAA